MSNYTKNRIPMGYNMLNLLDASVSPNVVHSSNTAVFHFFVKYLLQRLISVFKLKGLICTASSAGLEHRPFYNLLRLS